MEKNSLDVIDFFFFKNFKLHQNSSAKRPRGRETPTDSLKALKTKSIDSDRKMSKKNRLANQKVLCRPVYRDGNIKFKIFILFVRSRTIIRHQPHSQPRCWARVWHRHRVHLLHPYWIKIFCVFHRIHSGFQNYLYTQQPQRQIHFFLV